MKIHFRSEAGRLKSDDDASRCAGYATAMPKPIDFDPNDVGGWAVSVLTERLGGGEPMMVLYAAALPDQSAAIEAVCKWLGYLPGDGVGEANPISRQVVTALGRTPGEVWSFLER